MNTAPWAHWAWLALGLATAGQAALGWMLLHGRGDGRAVRLWSLGAMGLGLGLVLGAMHPVLPAWLGGTVAWALCIASPLLRLAALHRPRPAAEAGLTVWGSAHTSSMGSVLEAPGAEPGLAGAASTGLAGADAQGCAAGSMGTLPSAPKVDTPPLRAMAVLLLLPLALAAALQGSVWQAPALLAGWALAHLALAADCSRVRRQRRYRSAGLLAVGETTLAAVLLLSAAAHLHAGQAGHWLPGAAWAHLPVPTAAVLLAVAMCAALANLGGPGFTLDHLRRSRQRLGQQLANAAAQPRAAADAELWRQAVAERSALLAQRDALLAERAQLLQLAQAALHEPLADGAQGLQATRHAMDILPPPEAGALAPGLDQVDLALSRARDGLDNLMLHAQLAAWAPQQATWLAQGSQGAADAPAADTPAADTCEAAGLVHRAVQTLPEAWRSRVLVDNQLAHSADHPAQRLGVPARLAELALRNLLRNAFEHGHSSAPVRLQLQATEDGRTLRLCVCDRGPGLDSAAHSPGPGVPLPNPPGQGLALARRVAELHGGSLLLAPHPPFGLQATLQLPLAGAAQQQGVAAPALPAMPTGPDASTEPAAAEAEPAVAAATLAPFEPHEQLDPLPPVPMALLPQPLPDEATGQHTDKARALGAPATMGPGSALQDGAGRRAAAA